MATKAILTFNFAGLTPIVYGVVNEPAKTVALTVVYGTSVLALVPTITHNGSSISPASGVAQDFTLPVKYTVTGSDASTQDYWVTVIAPLGILKQYLMIADTDTSRDTLLLAMWNSALTAISNEIGYSVISHSVVQQSMASSMISFTDLPATTLTVAYRSDLTTVIADTALVAWVDYYIFARHILLRYHKSYLPDYGPRIILSYTAGWTTLPAPLEDAMRLYVAYKLRINAQVQPGEVPDMRMPNDILRLLDPYRVLSLP